MQARAAGAEAQADPASGGHLVGEGDDQRRAVEQQQALGCELHPRGERAGERRPRQRLQRGHGDRRALCDRPGGNRQQVPGSAGTGRAQRPAGGADRRRRRVGARQTNRRIDGRAHMSRVNDARGGRCRAAPARRACQHEPGPGSQPARQRQRRRSGPSVASYARRYANVTPTRPRLARQKESRLGPGLEPHLHALPRADRRRRAADPPRDARLALGVRASGGRPANRERRQHQCQRPRKRTGRSAEPMPSHP